jgi:hypothetical protein
VFDRYSKSYRNMLGGHWSLSSSFAARGTDALAGAAAHGAEIARSRSAPAPGMDAQSAMPSGRLSMDLPGIGLLIVPLSGIYVGISFSLIFQ